MSFVIPPQPQPSLSVEGTSERFPLHRIYCVGRNYAEHTREMGGDPTGGALHLRPTFEHTHFFSTAGRAEAGHYHYDVTPETIHYRGCFQLARRIVRVNDPADMIGR